jgi:putative Mn2+ efflux pump MntP
MPLNSVMSVMSVVEFALWAVLAYFFWTKKLQKRFPAMGAYLALRLVSTPLLLAILWWGHGYSDVAYFVGYYAVYILSAVLLFFVVTEIFRAALFAFSGLQRFGTVIFRWAAVVSAIVSLTTLTFSHHGIPNIPDIAYGLMRSVSIMELSLLAFLCLSMNALQLPIRDLSFGISLGFGTMASSDLIGAVVIKYNSTLNAPIQVFCEALILAALGVWVMYAALPEPARKPIVVAASSTIYRWNEIASALGHKGTKVAVPATANSFFLSDVEKVVDKVLTRNLRESESNT